jgi:hypothetical protein
MNILSAIFPKAKKVTSEAIAAEISRAEAEIAAHRAKITTAESAIATSDDDAHVHVIENNAALRRAIARLEARITALRVEHETAVAAEAEAEKIASATARQKRIEAARHAVRHEAADLLRSYDADATKLAGTLARIAEIEAEARECGVPGVDQMHRTIANQATECREMAPHYVYRDAPPQSDEVCPGEIEEIVRCTLDASGRPMHPAGVRYGRFGQVLTPQLEMREVVTRSGGRRAIHAPSLAEVRLPPASAGGEWHWPRP